MPSSSISYLGKVRSFPELFEDAADIRATDESGGPVMARAADHWGVAKAHARTTKKAGRKEIGMCSRNQLRLMCRYIMIEHFQRK